MNIFSELEIGDKLSIEINEKHDSQNENNMLSSQLIDIKNDHLYITAPIYKGQRYMIHENQDITIFFYRAKGIYKFNAQIVKQVDTNVITFIIKPIGNTLKIQRRDYFRLPIVAPAVLKLNKDDKTVEVQCIMKDLSAGGVKVVCKYKAEKLENLVIDLFLEDTQIITMSGQVVRVIKDIENNNYELGIRFNQTNQADIDRIFGFIFEKQRLLRKKGLI